MDETRTQIASMTFADGTTVRVEASQIGGSEDVVDLAKAILFQQVVAVIEHVAEEVMATLKKVKPDKASVEFGVEVAVETGGLTALLVKGSGKGNLKITLEWGK
jgi:Trypsin-co-occurring domain 1